MEHHPAFRLWTLGLRTTWMLADAQTVVTLRLWGIAGLWPVPPSEASRMVSEKWPTFLQSAGAAGAAMMKGHGPDRIAEAALMPIGRRARTNARRLARSKTRRRP